MFECLGNPLEVGEPPSPRRSESAALNDVASCRRCTVGRPLHPCAAGATPLECLNLWETIPWSGQGHLLSLHPGPRNGHRMSPRLHSVKAKRYSTRYSRVVTQRSTDLAQSSLPSVIGRERGHSGWYDRSMVGAHFLMTTWLSNALPGARTWSRHRPSKHSDS